MSAFVTWMEHIFLWLQSGVELSVIIWVLVVLPMLCFRRSRERAAMILMYSSYFNGFTCWWYSFIICYRACGLLWLIIGLLLTGLGIVPLAIIGVAVRGYWPTFWNLILALAFAFGPRIVAVAVAYRVGKREDANEQLAAAAFEE